MNISDVFDLIEKLPVNNLNIVKKSIIDATNNMLEDAESEEMINEIKQAQRRISESNDIDEIKTILQKLEDKRK